MLVGAEVVCRRQLLLVLERLLRLPPQQLGVHYWAHHFHQVTRQRFLTFKKGRENSQIRLVSSSDLIKMT